MQLATVTAATLSALQVTPVNAKLAVGFERAYQATGTFSDGSKRDVSDSVTWTTSDASLASASNADGSRGVVTGVKAGVVSVTATQGSAHASTTLTITTATLTKLEIDPAGPALPLGTSQAFAAIGTFSDNTTQDLTTQVSWTSSDPSVATIDAGGFLQTVKVGSTELSAKHGSVTGTATVTVTSAALTAIAVTPVAPSIAKGLTQQFTATGSYTRTVTWSSSNADIVDVSNGGSSKGLALAKATGSANVTAVDPATPAASTSATVNFTVTPGTLNAIVVKPAAAKLPVGYGLQYVAIGEFSDGEHDISAQVSWSTLNPAVVTIDDSGAHKGFAQAKAVGTTTVRATLNGVQGTTTVTAVALSLSSIAVTPADASIGRGGTLQYTATGTFADSSTLDLTAQVTWGSSNTNAATISNADGSKGLATAGPLLGTTTITAISGSVSGSATLRRRIGS